MPRIRRLKGKPQKLNFNYDQSRAPRRICRIHDYRPFQTPTHYTLLSPHAIHEKAKVFDLPLSIMILILLRVAKSAPHRLINNEIVYFAVCPTHTPNSSYRTFFPIVQNTQCQVVERRCNGADRSGGGL
jgi:hypothetical protein